MPINLDMTGVKTSFEPLPVGNYPVVVEDSEEGVSKKGNDMITLTLSVTSEEYEGRKLFLHLVVLENTLWKIKETMLALGWSEDELDGPMELDAADFLNLEAIAVVTQDTWQGKVVNRVDQLVSFDDAEDLPLAEDMELEL